jgi:two-component sensor histidine kinase
MLIPEERHEEERDILGRIRRGERVDHYQTIRQHKNGSPLHISLTVSPLRDDQGNVVGASKIARDIGETLRAQEMQRLLLDEMQHRIKNVFAVATGLIGLCATRAETPAELADMARNRLQALARAHALTMPVVDGGKATVSRATLRSLLSALVVPAVGDEETRVSFRGDDVTLSTGAVTPIALVLNELVTNATKHGALRENGGTVDVECRRAGSRVVLTWQERMDDAPTSPPPYSGFGTHLSQVTVEHQLGGTIEREWKPTGLSVTIAFGEEQLAPGRSTR